MHIDALMTLNEKKSQIFKNKSTVYPVFQAVNKSSVGQNELNTIGVLNVKLIR